MFSILDEIKAIQPIRSIVQPQAAPKGYRSKRRGLFNNKINRWTGKPHEHRREVARNLRQQKYRRELKVAAF